MKNAHAITREFEAALCEYTGAPYAVAVNSCTMALLLAVAWHLRMFRRSSGSNWDRTRLSHPFDARLEILAVAEIEIPKRTYVSVPMSIIHAGGRPTFRDEEWSVAYQLKPLPVWDSARWFTSGMYRGPFLGKRFCDGEEQNELYDHADRSGEFWCLSFHASKTCGDSQGGAILHDNAEADAWFRKARFDGRTEGVAPKHDTFDMVGWHCYMSPDVAARLLWKLSVLPKHNEPLPNDDYSDLSTMEIFK